MSNQLQVRLRNCLQTILEMEPDISSLSVRAKFNTELEIIKEYLDRVEDLDLAEEDVLRLERATANFLDELRLPLWGAVRGARPKRVLQ